MDFTQGASDVFAASTGGTAVTYDPSLGAVFSIATDGDAPTFTSKSFLFFGTVDVTMRAAPGAGIVSTIVLQSSDLDEIDWEFLGGNNAMGQSNYFSKGDTGTYGKLEQDIAISDNSGAFHTYTVDWTPEKIEWKVDGVSMRTLNAADNPSRFPQTPMQVKIGTWCGGCSAAEGTRAWAGGPPNWANAPFNAYYKSINIQDRSNGVAGAVSYSYGDQSGSMGSIIVNTDAGGVTGNSGDAPSSGSSVSTDRVASSTQSAATTLSTATTNGSSTTSTSSSVSQSTGAANSTTTGGSGSSGNTTPSSTGNGATSETSPVAAGADKTAVSLIMLVAGLLAVASL